MKIKIIFFGSSSYVIPIIESLNKNFDLSLVITTEKNPTDVIPSFCKKNNINFLSIQQFNNETIEQLQKLKASVAVLADFGLVIPNKILNMFPKGILNVHPSLLPKYRGPTPVQNAILNGDKVTGISIIKLDNELDHGPILFQQKEEILPQDSAKSLYERLFLKSANLLPDIINKYLNGSLKLNAQNHKKATFTKPLTRADGYINISKINPSTSSGQKSKIKLERMIKAYCPWPGVWTRLRQGFGGQSKIIKLLPEQKIQVEGKKPISYKDFINGYPDLKQIHSLLGQL